MKYQTARTFLDLEVYKTAYQAAITVNTKIVPYLPNEEKFELKSQMRRASKSVPALIAEGYAKKQHQKSWKKYLDDAIGECNEMIVHLSFTKDLYSDKVGVKLCEELIQTYDIAGKQLYSLGRSWRKQKK